MNRIRIIWMTVAAAATLSLGAVMPAHAVTQPGCLSDQQIQTAIASGKIKSWPKVKKLAQISPDYQEVSDVKVCMIDGVPYYTVNLVSTSGDAKKIVLNAVDGSG
jgi:uncharacterized membrane protein YkoI